MTARRDDWKVKCIEALSRPASHQLVILELIHSHDRTAEQERNLKAAINAELALERFEKASARVAHIRSRAVEREKRLRDENAAHVLDALVTAGSSMAEPVGLQVAGRQNGGPRYCMRLSFFNSMFSGIT